VASYPFRIFCIVIPVLYWVFGVCAVKAGLGEAISQYFPYFVSHIAATVWIGGGRMLPMMAEVSQLLIVPDIAKAVVAGFVKTHGHGFKVTAKGGQRDAVTVQWRRLSLFVALGVATVLGIAFAFIFEENRFIADGGALCLFWSWYNLAIIVICCLVCIEQPRYRKHERYSARERAVLSIGDRRCEEDVLDISPGGILIRGTLGEPVGTRATIALRGLREPAIIVRKGTNHVAFKIEGEEARHAMIRHVYSGRYGGAPIDVRGSRVALTIFQRAFR
jgi:cellulose synthase (UDP-forming)